MCMKHNQINTISQSYSKLSQIFCATDGNMGRGQSLWGDKKKEFWWVAADRDPQIFGKLLQTYESESGHAKIPQSRWDINSLSFSSHSGSSCHTTLLSSTYDSVTFLTFHPFGHSLPSLKTLNPSLHGGPNWFGYSLFVFKNTKYSPSFNQNWLCFV